jgi:hypothetical protein
MAAPLRHSSRNHFLQIIQSQAPFVLRSERLIPKLVPVNLTTISPIGLDVIDIAAQFAANYGGVAVRSLFPPGCDHEVAIGIFPKADHLAGGGGREEDCELKKINRR